MEEAEAGEAGEAHKGPTPSGPGEGQGTKEKLLAPRAVKGWRR